MKGRSPITSAFGAPRTTALAWRIMSSMVTLSVSGYPSMVMPRLSPTSSTGMPARSSQRAVVKS